MQFLRQIADVILWVDWKVIFPVLTALAGAWTQAHLSQKSQRRTRLWDLQREAYGEVLASLRDARLAVEDIASQIRKLDDDLSGVTPDLQAIIRQFVDHHNALHRRIARDGIILSDAFHELVRLHWERWETINSMKEPHTVKSKAFADELKRFADEITHLARKELSRP